MENKFSPKIHKNLIIHYFSFKLLQITAILCLL